MKSVVVGVGLCAALAFATPPAFAQATRFDGIDWTRVMRALSNALNSWRLSPFPRRTPTPIRPRTATVAASQSTPTHTVRLPTSTHTLPPATRTRTATRTGTSTRTRTSTRTPSLTPSPRPTSTPAPTTSNNGQIAFGEAEGIPPAQKLASAFVVFPYLVTKPPFDTRIELMNMSNREIGLQCFYVRESDCVEIGFFVSLTANQPLSWSAFDGVSNTLTRTRVPPLDTLGSFAELKCAVDTDQPELSAQNVLQGRAIVVDRTNGETVGYGAVGFQRLSPGAYNGVVDLDGFTYESCPERLHFQVLTVGSGGPSSSLITVPCAQDLLTQTPTETVVQMQIVNEFEQVFSSSYRFTCLSSQSLGKFITLTKSVAGGNSAHLIIRGVSTPLIGLAIDRFSGQNNTLHTTANEPFLEGGRPATVIFP